MVGGEPRLGLRDTIDDSLMWPVLAGVVPVRHNSASSRLVQGCARAVVTLFAWVAFSYLLIRGQALTYHTFVAAVSDAESGDPVVGALSEPLETIGKGKTR